MESYHHHFARYFKDKQLEPFIYVLSKRMESGHICIPLDQTIKDDLVQGGYHSVEFEIADTSILTVINFENKGEDTPKKPFVLYQNKLYLQRYYVYESKVLSHLEKFSVLDEENLAVLMQDLLNHKEFVLNAISPKVDLAGYNEDEKVDWQAIAAILGYLNSLTIITGGPGTGKTTTVAKILAILNKVKGDDFSIALAAPTGKAAMRMKESLTASAKLFQELEIENVIKEAKPSTIHRLLGTQLNSPFFKYNKDNKLPYDIVIIDESSMIGVALFAKLLEAIKEGSKIILLGDSEQLASVDAGSLFGDICLSQKLNENRFPEDLTAFVNQLLQSERHLKITLAANINFLSTNFVRLKKTHRFKQDSTLGRFNRNVIVGNTQELQQIIMNKTAADLKIDVDYNRSFITDFVLKYKAYIEEDNISAALKKVNNCRILCAVKASEQGVYEVNEVVKQFLKKEYKDQKNKFNPDSEIFNNQLIMVTKNQPEMNLFNGDIGLIRFSGKKLKAFFPKQQNEEIEDDKDYFEVTPAFIESWETVFAMTIHKSQGSEFNEVLVILPKKKENRLLTRELVYTGITRAKDCAYIQTSEEVLYTAVNQQVDRVSGLKDRILNSN